MDSLNRPFVILLLVIVLVGFATLNTLYPSPFITEEHRESIFEPPINDNQITLYQYYSSIERAETYDYTTYVVNPYDDSYLFDLTTSIIGSETDHEAISNLIGKYVQDISYQSEIEEYPKYPLETIQDGNGDCEDKSILASGLLDSIGISTALVRVEGHMLLSVDVNGWKYLETTRKGSILSKSVGYEIVDFMVVEEKPILFHTWQASQYSLANKNLYIEGTVTISNVGNAIAQNVELRVISGSSQRTFFDIEPQQTVDFDFRVSSNGEIYTQLYYNNKMVDDRRSQ